MRAVGVIALGLTATAVATAAPTRPTVRVVDLKPFTVHGARFDGGQHLRIVVRTKRRVVRRRLTASGTGAFTLKVIHLSVRRCGQYSVIVYGPNGRIAGVKSSAESCGTELQPL